MKPKAKWKGISEERYDPRNSLHTLLTLLAILVHQAQKVFRGIKCMVSSPDDANIPDLGSISQNLGKLSADDVNDFLGLGGNSPTIF
jgi:hypothetical protein